MRTILPLKAFLLLVLLVPFLASCGDDTVGPDDVTYPVTMMPKSVENKSTIKAFVREGSTWREITSENPAILTNEFFAESSVIQPDDDATITLTSATQWQADAISDTTFSYTYSDEKFDFAFLFDTHVYGTGDYSKFKQHMIVGMSGPQHMDARISAPSGIDPITALTSSPFPFPTEEGTIIAYQTFDIVYEAE